MYFEKTCKINNNGKVSGYHKRGKVENGNTTYFINDRFGDEEDLKRLERTPTIPTLGHSLFDSNTNDWFGFTPFDFYRKRLGEIPTYLNPHYFKLPDHRSIENDNDFIKYCEQQTKPKHHARVHSTIKGLIREHINEQLDMQGYVDPELLDDFRFAVENEKVDDTTATAEQAERWQQLRARYDPSYQTEAQPAQHE